jgi:hypothetical protein
MIVRLNYIIKIYLNNRFIIKNNNNRMRIIASVQKNNIYIYIYYNV